MTLQLYSGILYETASCIVCQASWIGVNEYCVKNIQKGDVICE